MPASKILGIEQELEFVDLSKARREELENLEKFAVYRRRIKDIVKLDEMDENGGVAEKIPAIDLPFI